MKGQACGGPLKTEVKELKGDLRPAPPYPSRVKTVDKGTQVTPEREAVRNKADFLHLSPETFPYVYSSLAFWCSRSAFHFLYWMECATLVGVLEPTRTLIWRLSKFILLQVAVKDVKGSKPDDEPPPMWFRSYMEKVKYAKLVFLVFQSTQIAFVAFTSWHCANFYSLKMRS